MTKMPGSGHKPRHSGAASESTAGGEAIEKAKAVALEAATAEETMRLHVHVPKPLMKALKREAVERETSLTALVTELLRDRYE